MGFSKTCGTEPDRFSLPALVHLCSGLIDIFSVSINWHMWPKTAILPAVCKAVFPPRRTRLNCGDAKARRQSIQLHYAKARPL